MQKMLLKKSLNLFSRLLLISLVFIFCLSSFAQTNEKNYVKGNHFIFDSVPLNLEEITNSAKRIFSGICEKKEEIKNDPHSHLSIVRYTFRVIEPIRGIDSEKITFSQWKPTAAEAGYTVGQKYVIFLYGESQLGLTSPVGYVQGKFHVEKKGSNRGVEYIKNRLNNVGLSKNLKTRRKIYIQEDHFLNDYIHDRSEKGKPIKYKDFIRAVRYLSAS